MGRFMEIIFLALITAYLLYRLWMVLGQETDVDQQRRDKKLLEAEVENNIIQLQTKQSSANLTLLEEELKPGAKAGLKILKAADPQFNLDHFVAGAKSAYEMIIAAFAESDKETLKQPLTRKVFAQFESAIEDRLANKLQLETIIENFDRVDIDSIDLLDRQATIAVRFRTSQVRLTKDESGTIIDNPAKISTSITDIWTFSHNIDADDPTWYLAATRTETNAY